MNTIASNIIYNLLIKDTIPSTKNKWCWTGMEPSQHRQPLCKAVLDKHTTTTSADDLKLIPQTNTKITFNFKYKQTTNNILCSTCGKRKVTFIIHSPDTDDLFLRCTQCFTEHQQRYKNYTYTQIMEQ